MNLIKPSCCLLSRTQLLVVRRFLLLPATSRELIAVKMNDKAAPRFDLWYRVLFKVLLLVEIWITRAYFHQGARRGALHVVVRDPRSIVEAQRDDEDDKCYQGNYDPN